MGNAVSLTLLSLKGTKAMKIPDMIAILVIIATTFVGSSIATAGLLDEIKAKGKMVVATEAALPPFEFVKDGKIVGYHIDLMNIVAERLGVKVEQLDLPWQGILPGLLAKRFDLVVTSVSITETRYKQFLFTVPTAEATSTLLVRKGDTRFKKPEDLIGSILGAQLNSAHHLAAKKVDERFQKEKGSGFKEIRTYTAYSEVFGDLANKRVDAATAGLPVLAVLLNERPGLYEIAFPIGERVYYGWPMRKEDTDLQRAINTVFVELKKSGKMREMQKKWFGFIMETPDDVKY